MDSPNPPVTSAPAKHSNAVLECSDPSSLKSSLWLSLARPRSTRPLVITMIDDENEDTSHPAVASNLRDLQQSEEESEESKDDYEESEKSEESEDFGYGYYILQSPGADEADAGAAKNTST